MDMPVEAKSEANALVALIDEANPYDMSFEELLPRQIKAVNERFQEQVGLIKLLRNRAETGNVSEVAKMEDVVPLLFAHTAYKSYPESWLFEGKWDRLGKWLETVSTGTVKPIEEPIKGLDHWLSLLEKQGHFMGCSSGTTGKCAMMDATAGDIEFSGKNLLKTIGWTGLNPNHDRFMVGLGLVASTPKNIGTGRPMAEAFMKPGQMPFMPSVPPITIGGMVEMVVLRKKLADGTAKPSEAAYYEEEAARRERDTARAIEQAADAVIEHRGEKLHITGMYGALYKVSVSIRERGYSGKDFQENSAFLSGGLKRANVPADYREFIFATLNLTDDFFCYD